MERSKRRPRTDRPKRCEKPGSCLGHDGESISLCNNAPPYGDYAFPLSENACLKTISEHSPQMFDPYKETYIRISHRIDQTLADPYVTKSPKNLDIRFSSFERELEELIVSPELSEGNNGRYLYHIDARMLQAYLGAFHHRALHGLENPMPREIIETTYRSMADILTDFDGLYNDIAAPVAFKRTEIEIPMLLLRTKSSEWFTYATFFREDASATRRYNHDSYTPNEQTRTRIQIKNAEYENKSGKLASEDYDEDTVVAIHQHVVNLDFRDGETHVTVVNPVVVNMDQDDIDPYISYEDKPRFIAWGAEPTAVEDIDVRTEYIQKISGFKRDGFVDALVREARGEKLSIEDLNLLNGASHYLMAAIREKR